MILDMNLDLQRDIVIRLAAAVACGAVLGLNRELHAKRAGVRTQGTVALGAALVTVTAWQLASPVDVAAVSRVMQGIVAGIGFLGAGVIVHGARTKEVHGLTTAAITWLSAGLGIACGAGQWIAAIAAVLLVLLLLIVGGPAERYVRRTLRPLDAPNGEAPDGDAPSSTPPSTPPRS